MKQFLNKHYGYSEFRPGQREIIEAVINRRNVLGVLATGGGKTLCYQFASEWLEGITIIVSPLISLMEDQWTRIRQNGNKKVGLLHSGLNKERYDFEWNEIRSNRRKMIFLSPERLNHPQTLKKLSQLYISLLVIDEAHCISQWGYDFRPDYLSISNAYSALGFPTIMALTGTASPKVQEDIMDKLKMQDSKEVVLSMNRPNITFYNHCVTSDEEKRIFLFDQLNKLSGPGIIYVNTRKQTEQLANWLSEKLGVPVPAYHAGLTNEDRSIIQTQFIIGQAPILVATSAFGMGIDKDNIRFVIHYQIPISIEGYLQEVGRVGRDGKDGIAIILYNKSDLVSTKSFIDYSVPNKENLEEIIKWLQLEKGKLVYNHELYEHMPIKSILHQLQQGGWITGGMNADDLHWIKEVSEHDIDNLVSLWDRIRFEKYRNLENIKDILESDQCLRKQLLQFLMEADHHYSSYCCSVCGCELQYYIDHSSIFHEIKQMDDFNWRDEVERLLPVNTTSKLQ